MTVLRAFLICALSGCIGVHYDGDHYLMRCAKITIT